MIYLLLHMAAICRCILSRGVARSALSCGVMVIAVVASTGAEAQPVDSLRVMSYNILVGGAKY